MNIHHRIESNIPKKKILHIVEAMGGGVFTYIVDLANQLCDEYDVYIAYAVRPQTPEDYREYFDKNINLIEVKNFTRTINFSRDFKAFLEIRSIAKKVKPDIIHLHSSKAGILGRFAFNGHKTPIFYTPHGYSFLMQNCGMLKRTVYKIIEILSGKRYCTTISCSYGEHKETLKLTKNARYVSNGINVDVLQGLIEKQKINNTNRKFTVYTLGRICSQKNPEEFNSIAKKLPDIRFLWIGDGELRDKLTSPNIDVTGWVDRETALQYSMQGDVFILTSLWEGLPISLLESMYMKKVCVVSNVIGNRDVIKNGMNGFVCNNIIEFVEALNDIKNGYNSNLIKYAYDDIMKEYNTNVMSKKYSLIYEQGMSGDNEKNRNYFIRIFSGTSG
ncbi:alpha-1,4-N-acetyl-D-galactosaminyltransferase [Clostridium sp. BL-8]|nr:alpha-1,4-N-acetyl-D-galactosaminyltransferase [Clostridium sp. BL-8]